MSSRSSRQRHRAAAAPGRSWPTNWASTSPGGALAIVITEAGTNILKHAGEGTLYVMRAQSGAAMAGIDVLAVDNGPGIADLDASLQRRRLHRRHRRHRAGRAAPPVRRIRRLVDAGKGAPSSCACGAAARRRVLRVEVGALYVPLAGEDECGDGWA
jgi:anti-sigma regulatory factor (Ser/Thr protein kinase)